MTRSHPLPSIPRPPHPGACLCSVGSGGTARGAALMAGSPLRGCVALSGAGFGRPGPNDLTEKLLVQLLVGVRLQEGDPVGLLRL